MKTASELYRRLLVDPEHTKETMVSIAGVDYAGDEVIDCSSSRDFLSDYDVGMCCAREIDLTIESYVNVPRAAQIKVSIRLVSGEEKSEWVPAGVFYVDTRSENDSIGLLTLHGFDALRLAQAVWIDPAKDEEEWPISQQAAAKAIAQRIGTTVDPRSRFQTGVQVEYPNDSTMWEVLCHIATSHCGNWFVTDEGKLLLVPLFGFPPETSLLVDDESGGAILFGDVRIIV